MREKLSNKCSNKKQQIKQETYLQSEQDVYLQYIDELKECDIEKAKEFIKKMDKKNKRNKNRIDKLKKRVDKLIENINGGD